MAQTTWYLIALAALLGGGLALFRGPVRSDYRRFGRLRPLTGLLEWALALAGQPVRVAAEISEHTGDRGDTDAIQGVHELWAEVQLIVLRQVSCHGRQGRLQALGAREVEVLSDQPTTTSPSLP